jgi:hypothetical protein
MTQELPPEEAPGLKGMGSLIVDVCGKTIGWWKAQYRWPHSTNELWSAAFLLKIVLIFFMKLATLRFIYTPDLKG